MVAPNQIEQKDPPRPKIVKKILNAGRGKPNEWADGTKAVFNYEAFRPEGWKDGQPLPEARDQWTSIDSTKRHHPDGYGEPLEIVFGKKFQLPVWETCLRSMLEDEICQFDIEASELFPYPMVSKKLRDINMGKCKDSGHGHSHGGGGSTHMCAATMAQGTGYPALDDLMKEPKPLRFIIHLLKVLPPDAYEADSWQLSNEEKLESVETLRLEGNESFKKGGYEEAIGKYREALTRLDNLLLREKPGEPEWEVLDVKNVSLYLNLTQCYLSTGAMYEAIAAADEVIKRDEFNEKALYRRAKAHIGTWQLDEAESDLRLLSDNHPGAKALAEAELAVVERKREEKARGQKNTYKNMFRHIGKQ